MIDLESSFGKNNFYICMLLVLQTMLYPTPLWAVGMGATRYKFYLAVLFFHF